MGKENPAISSVKKSSSTDFEVVVRLARADFMYYNWVVALERPMLPFLMYSFIFFNLVSMVGFFPAGRLFAFAVLIPLIGYVLLVYLTARRFWATLPQLQEVRQYRFMEQGYEILMLEPDVASSAEEARGVTICYSEVQKIIGSRRGVYLIRNDGSADLFPIDAVDVKTFLPFLEAKLAPATMSAFL